MFIISHLSMVLGRAMSVCRSTTNPDSPRPHPKQMSLSNWTALAMQERIAIWTAVNLGGLAAAKIVAVTVASRGTTIWNSSVCDAMREKELGK